MNVLCYRASLVVGAIMVFAVPSGAVSYKATILPMPLGAASAKAYGAADGSQVGSAFFEGSGRHAVLWNGTSTSSIDLHPLTGYENSTAYAVAGQAQVGDARIVGPFDNYHALLWRGSADSVVDLNPSGYLESTARGVSGNSQVGWGRPQSATGDHALLWHGSAASVVDLNPPGFRSSQAYAVSGNSQFGFGRRQSAPPHAILWRGTAESFVDLHPAGWYESALAGGSGDIQVGIVRKTSSFSDTRAAVWRGSADSFVDLHPQGFSFSLAWAAAGNFQVGYGVGPSIFEHALVWNGTADSVVDLHQFLPPTLRFVFSSQATGIAEDGTIVGYAGQYDYAILWTPIVPEPDSGAIFALGLILTSLLPRRHANY
jgi:hypothetical protein